MSTHTTSPETPHTAPPTHPALGGRAAGSDRPRAADVVRTGLLAGAAAGMMMAMWQMVVGAIADEPTAVEGISSSFWTAVTAIPSVLFGSDWFHADFEFWPVVLGVGGHMMNAMMIGVVGVALLAVVLGRRPSPVAAVMQGVIFGLLMEVVIIHLIVNPIQDINTLYTSTPEWSWWASHVVYGMTLGAVGSLLLRRLADKHGERRPSAGTTTQPPAPDARWRL